jgi:nuclear-control-of-ATPase protein 2
MSFLFASAPPSYADEQLRTHLASLSTLSIAPSADFSSSGTGADAKPSPGLQNALHDLTASSPPDHDTLVSILKELGKSREAVTSYASQVDELVEAEVMGRAVVLVWKEVLQSLVEGALQLEEEKLWWDGSLEGRRGVITYLVQSESTIFHRCE